eukprot:COSAG01_NODE_1379_length_10522_cov_25.951454_17_plen_81_part_00
MMSVSLGECWEPPPEVIQNITKIFNKKLEGLPNTLRIGSITAKGLYWIYRVYVAEFRKYHRNHFLKKCTRHYPLQHQCVK